MGTASAYPQKVVNLKKSKAGLSRHKARSLRVHLPHGICLLGTQRKVSASAVCSKPLCWGVICTHSQIIQLSAKSSFLLGNGLRQVRFRDCPLLPRRWGRKLGPEQKTELRQISSTFDTTLEIPLLTQHYLKLLLRNPLSEMLGFSESGGISFWLRS